MSTKNAQVAAFLLFSLLLGASCAPSCFASPATTLQPQGQSAAAIAKSIGVIKTINGSVITLAPESGPEITATVQPNARLLRLAPGDKDLKNATPIALQDLQVGDTVRVRGYASADAKSITTLEVIVITRSALAAVSGQISQDWQKRGLAGPVTAVDPAAGTVTISIPSLAEKKTVTIHTTSSTVIHRYAPDSARAEDAKTIQLQGIQVNDQLRVRGNRSADGSEITAEEIYTGVFPQFIGTIKSIDASASTLSVQDLVTKKTIELKVTADSQLHQVPAEMAQRMAIYVKRMKQGGTSGSAPAGGNGTPSGPPPGATTMTQAGTGGAGAGGAGGAGGSVAPGGGMRAGGPGGFQRMLDAAPATTLADLHKGDALAIVATEGTASTGGTIIKLYSGVEPILEAAPNAMMLAPWSLGGAPGGDAASQ
jgi:hypothetical protein